MSELINIPDHDIKFKGIQYFMSQNGNVRLWDAFMNIKIANTQSVKLLITLKRIREALQKEGALLDEAIKEIQGQYVKEVDDAKVLPEIETDEFKEMNDKINELLSVEIEIPLPKIKLSQIQGITSLAELDALDGIIEIDEE